MQDLVTSVGQFRLVVITIEGDDLSKTLSDGLTVNFSTLLQVFSGFIEARNTIIRLENLDDLRVVYLDLTDSLTEANLFHGFGVGQAEVLGKRFPRPVLALSEMADPCRVEINGSNIVRIIDTPGPVNSRVHPFVLIASGRSIVTPAVLTMPHRCFPATAIDLTTPVKIPNSLAITSVEDDVFVAVIGARLRIEASDLSAAVNAHKLVLLDVTTTSVTGQVRVLTFQIVSRVVSVSLLAVLTLKRRREWLGPNPLRLTEMVVVRIR
ncbi:hypothetical protein PNQ92_07670 [Halobacterium salinarum]|uniref:hypothetical protein n=1 Tax=Halobacterium salinarum TaxID=2242 RepID=UPI002554FF46|nr:hypothetical protein [Halobacterium salinarum]MDL0125289.1 hypothetical protein [Halobacterium salinarum]MDL0133789.1 hypothetical protein [Halobacterium salinarum]